MCPKWPQNCQQWPNFENNFTYLRPSRRRREGRHYRKHMLDDPPNMIDLINYVFCSSQSLCSNHSMWPFVAFYVPEVHGDIPPSLMVLFESHLNTMICPPSTDDACQDAPHHQCPSAVALLIFLQQSGLEQICKPNFL